MASPRWSWPSTAGDRSAESNLLNTLGMAKAHAAGARRGGHAAAPCDRRRGARPGLDGVSTAYENLADMLGLAGRSREALAGRA